MDKKDDKQRELLLTEIEARKRELALLERQFSSSQSRKDSLVVLYGRQSKGADEQVWTKDAQLEQMREFVAKRFGSPCPLKIVELYDEDESAYTIDFFERTQGRKANLILERGDHLVISKTDRVFRNVRDQSITIEILTMRGVHIHFLDLGVDTTSSVGKLMLQITTSVAEMESHRKQERIIAGLKQRRAKGLRHSRPPFGWKFVGQGKSQRYVECIEDRQLGEVMLGLYNQGKTAEEIAFQLSQMGFKNHRKQRRPGREWIIRAEFYENTIVDWIMRARMGYPKVTKQELWEMPGGRKHFKKCRPPRPKPKPWKRRSIDIIEPESGDSAPDVF